MKPDSASLVARFIVDHLQGFIDYAGQRGSDQTAALEAAQDAVDDVLGDIGTRSLNEHKLMSQFYLSQVS